MSKKKHKRWTCKECGASTPRFVSICNKCKQEEALADYADVEMFGEEDAQYFKDAGLEFGNK